MRQKPNKARSNFSNKSQEEKLKVLLLSNSVFRWRAWAMVDSAKDRNKVEPLISKTILKNCQLSRLNEEIDLVYVLTSVSDFDTPVMPDKQDAFFLGLLLLKRF